MGVPSISPKLFRFGFAHTEIYFNVQRYVDLCECRGGKGTKMDIKMKDVFCLRREETDRRKNVDRVFVGKVN